ncbi:hypothetical protein [Actinoplanes sp. TFC3]|uniref:hypothetical protein n=1 Tax=Actinoplanes sp. TFC3 TaxID=1710355 RepID=UPI0012900B9E|nr:hypothetical protein [Actinoplanes sp. TFC3]
MRLILSALLTTALAVLSPAGPASATPAAPAVVKMTFDAAPEPVVKGATITLTGRVWLKATGNRTKVNFYFQKAGTPASAYVYQGYATTTDAGTFTRRFTATTTGTWKAVFAGTASRKNAARVDEVQVVQRRSKEIATYGPLKGYYATPTIRIPSADYKAIATYSCEDDGLLVLVWNGQPDVGEAVGSDEVGGTVTLNGHLGARSGYFEVGTWPGCTWTLRIFAGIVTTQV